MTSEAQNAFGAESRDGRSMNTSGRGNSKQNGRIKHSRMCSSEQGKDLMMMVVGIRSV